MNHDDLAVTTESYAMEAEKVIQPVVEDLPYIKLDELEGYFAKLDAFAKLHCISSSNEDFLMSYQNLKHSEFLKLLNKYTEMKDVDSLQKMNIALFLLLSQDKNAVFTKNKMLQRISRREIKAKEKIKILEWELTQKNVKKEV